MAKKGRSRGSVGKDTRGRLTLRFWWDHPESASDEYRWTVSTSKKDSPAAREELKHQLAVINAQIQAGAFYPCTVFPGAKIAAYCKCPACVSLTPLSNAHLAPRTLGDLLSPFKEHEALRASGPRRSIELKTLETKLSCIAALETRFKWKDPEGSVWEIDPLSNYLIRELTPEAVKDWCLMYIHRQGRATPNNTKWAIDILSTVRQAIRLGQLKRWWRDHPLLEYEGILIEVSKEERHRRENRTLTKPFTLVERDKIIDWFRRQWAECDPAKYAGKEKVRLFFLYHYMRIGFNTGLRSPSEMTALEWADVDYARQRLQVRKSRHSTGAIEKQVVRPYTKTIRHREVPLNDVASESFRALEEFRQESEDSVFWNPRAAVDNPFITPNGWAPLTGEKRIRYQFDKCLEALGIDSPNNQGQYRMRHTFVTLVLDNTDLADAKVAAMIGDSVETMRAHYQGHCLNRWRDEDDINQLNALNQLGAGKLRSVK
ncbi:MAG: hypothetical protein Hals2KO_21230 [Halioglobus sp.]